MVIIREWLLMDPNGKSNSCFTVIELQNGMLLKYLINPKPAYYPISRDELNQAIEFSKPIFDKFK